MTRDELRATVLAALADVAPEADTARLDAARPLREQLDLDSYDWLSFLVRLHETAGVEVPEADYARVTTLDALLDYLSRPPGGP